MRDEDFEIKEIGDSRMTQRVFKYIEDLKTFSEEERNYIARAIIEDRLVDIGPLLVMYITKLQSDNDILKNDVVKVADAGATLAEGELRTITGIGGRKYKLNKRTSLGLVRCLLEAGAHYGSKYGDDLRQSIDISDVDEDWYEHCWQPKGKIYPIKQFNDQTNGGQDNE